jgi:hypothetical protein
VPGLLRDLLDGRVDAVLLEDARLRRERDRREAGPAADADVHLVLRHGASQREPERKTHCNAFHKRSPRLCVQRCYSY